MARADATPTRSRERGKPEPATTARRLRVETFRCDALDDAEPQALAVTYWFDAAPHGTPYSVRIRLEGRRIGARGKPGRRDRFSVTETVDGVVPGSGRIAITTRIPDVAPGEWHVTASPIREPVRGPAARAAMASASSSGSTGFAPVLKIRAPGARLGARPALVGIGAVMALAVQSRSAAAARAGAAASRVAAGFPVASLTHLPLARGTHQSPGPPAI